MKIFVLMTSVCLLSLMLSACTQVNQSLTQAINATTDQAIDSSTQSIDQSINP